MKLFGRDRTHRISALVLGLGFVAFVVALVLVIGFQPQLRAALLPGTTMKAEFASNYRQRLVVAKTYVKIGGVESGKVTSIEQTDHDTTLVTMKLDADPSIIGAAPKLQPRPKTILGGGYYIDLVPGGGGSFPDGGTVPIDHTSDPVDLDTVLDTLPGGTRAGLQRIVGQTDTALAAGGRDGLRGVLTHAPGTLEPTGVLLDAAQGTNKQQDLPRLVDQLEGTARVIAARQPSMDAIVTDLDQTTGKLAQRAGALHETIAGLPSTLRTTRSGLAALSGTLDRLTDTAPAFRPSAKALSPLLHKLDPVLSDAEPLLHDLRPLLHDARPLVQQLVPASEHTTSVLDDVRGPVIDRINGPILNQILTPWVGTGPFQGNPTPIQRKNKFYEELGYLLVNLNRTAQVQDANGSTLAFQAGAGSDSPNAGPLSLADFFKQICATAQPTGPSCIAQGNPGVQAANQVTQGLTGAVPAPLGGANSAESRGGTSGTSGTAGAPAALPTNGGGR